MTEHTHTDPLEGLVPLLEAKGWVARAYTKGIQGGTGPIENHSGITLIKGVPFQVNVTDEEDCCTHKPALQVRVGGPGQLSTESTVGSIEQAVHWLEWIMPLVQADIDRAQERLPSPGWEVWRPSTSSTGICLCGASSPFAMMFRKDDILRCSKCVPRGSPPKTMYDVVKDALVERGWKIDKDAKENSSCELREFIHPESGKRMPWIDALLDEYHERGPDDEVTEKPALPPNPPVKHPLNERDDVHAWARLKPKFFEKRMGVLGSFERKRLYERIADEVERMEQQCAVPDTTVPKSTEKRIKRLRWMCATTAQTLQPWELRRPYPQKKAGST